MGVGVVVKLASSLGSGLDATVLQVDLLRRLVGTREGRVARPDRRTARGKPNSTRAAWICESFDTLVALEGMVARGVA